MYCRRCGTPTEARSDHPWCPSCGRPDYINPSPAVGVAIVRDGKVLLAQRAREPKAGQWDMVGGFVDPGETVPEAARREVLEETGLRIARLRRLHQATGHYHPDQPTLNFMYVAEAEGQPVARDDVACVAWFSLDRLPELAWEHEAEALRRLARARVSW